MSARGAPELLGMVHPAVRRTAVVLLHGLCSTPDELLTVQSALRKQGYAAHPLTIHGYSFDAAAPLQRAAPFQRWLDAVEAHVRALRAQHDKVLLVGISAGASLALGAAMRCGREVDALVLMSTTLRFDGWAIPKAHVLLPLAFYTPLGRFWKYRERPPYGVKNKRVRAWVARELHERKISRAGSAVIGIDHLREHDRLIRHVRRNLHRVACDSVLALHARRDEVAGVSNLDLLARGLRCRDFRSVVLGNSYHMITIDNDRQQVVRETLAFAEAVAYGTAPAAPALLTFDRVAALLEKDFHVEPGHIEPTAALADLGLDSLTLMEFVFAVEDAFGLRIPEERLDPRDLGITLQRLCEVIDQEVQAAKASPPAGPQA